MARRHSRVAIACVAFFCSMFALAYAAVPLYNWFCRATGLGGTPQIARSAPTGSEIPLSREITVRFDANLGPGLPWRFEAVTKPVRLRIGEPFIATYRATSLSDHETVGTAAYNVTPQQSGGYFFKVECFCFTEQRLAPRQSAELSVSFYVDPDLVKDSNLDSLDTITLSYTFFPARQPVRSSAVSASDASAALTAIQPKGAN